MITNWQVMQEMHLSDHHMLSADLPVLPDVMPLRKGRNLKKADWKEFTQHIKTAFSGYTDPMLWTAQTIDIRTTFLHKAIEAALDVVAPITPYRPKKSIFSWWNDELNDLQKNARKAHNYAKQQPHDTERWSSYHELRKKFSKECSKARTASWRTFRAEQVSPTQAARLNKILQQKTYHTLGLLQKTDGSLTKTVEKSHAMLMAEHFPGSQLLQTTTVDNKEGPDPTGATGHYEHPVLVDKLSWINLETLHHVFNQFGSHKCPGPDGFRPIVLMHLPLEARTALLHIYNAIISQKYTPRLWRNADIIFLPIPGKDDYTQSRSFRPISLMPFLLKTLEKMAQR
jgi:hypothetical protein